MLIFSLLVLFLSLSLSLSLPIPLSFFYRSDWRKTLTPNNTWWNVTTWTTTREQNELAWKRRQKFTAKPRKIWIIFEKFTPTIAPDLFNTNAMYPSGLQLLMGDGGLIRHSIDIEWTRDDRGCVCATRLTSVQTSSFYPGW
jgi:hypothetical protein